LPVFPAHHQNQVHPDYLAGRASAIWAERDRKIEAAREQRRLLREKLASEPRAA
jgi:hypothetical protein